MKDTGTLEAHTCRAVSSGPGSLAMMPSMPLDISIWKFSGVNSSGI